MHVECFTEMKKNLAKYGKGRVLDVGSLQVKPQHETYRELCSDYVGTDILPGANVDVVCTDVLPFDDESFDTVISGSCFEHVKNPFKLITECARVLKPGGYFLGVAPREWPEHHNPDCWRFLPDGWKALFEYAKLEAIDAYVFQIGKLPEGNITRADVKRLGFSDCWGIARKNEKS